MINQDIFDFWNANHVIQANHIGKYTHYYVVKNGVRTVFARISNSDNNTIEYYYDDNLYEEEQMLRIIKLKAFI